MNIKEFLAVVDKGWVRKPQGFRVHFEKITPDGPVVDYVPGLDQDPQESDVVAWRIDRVTSIAASISGSEAEVFSVASASAPERM